jgi:hypothetical protein
MTHPVWLSVVVVGLIASPAAAQAQAAFDSALTFTVVDEPSHTASEPFRAWAESGTLVLRGADHRLPERSLEARLDRSEGSIHVWITDAPPITTLKGVNQMDWIPVRFEARVGGLAAGQYRCEVVRDIQGSGELVIASDTVMVGS